MYFNVLKILGWVEATKGTESSAIQDYYSPTSARTYYMFTRKGIEAGSEYWTNPLFTLYLEIGSSHFKK
jgi:hypothetical protein